MKTVAWLFVIGIIAGLGFWLWRVRQAWIERQRAAEERYSSLLVTAQVPPGAAAAPPAATADSATQKLLFDAAAKAGEAGEPALCIQLYAKLLSRYPQTPLAAQVRAAVEVQKKKFSKPQSPA
jgi:chromate transport protein ChrA